MKALALHSKTRVRNLIKPGLLIAATILSLTVGATANASNKHHGYNSVSSISFGFTYSPDRHQYYQRYRQPHNYVRYNDYYPVSYSYYKPRRGHGYKYRKVHHKRYGH